MIDSTGTTTLPKDVFKSSFWPFLTNAKATIAITFGQYILAPFNHCEPDPFAVRLVAFAVVGSIMYINSVNVRYGTRLTDIFGKLVFKFSSEIYGLLCPRSTRSDLVRSFLILLGGPGVFFLGPTGSGL